MNYILHKDYGGDYLCHYGRKGMHWGRHIFGEAKRQVSTRSRAAARSAKRGLDRTHQKVSPAYKEQRKQEQLQKKYYRNKRINEKYANLKTDIIDDESRHRARSQAAEYMFKSYQAGDRASAARNRRTSVRARNAAANAYKQASNAYGRASSTARNAANYASRYAGTQARATARSARRSAKSIMKKAKQKAAYHNPHNKSKAQQDVWERTTNAEWRNDVRQSYKRNLSKTISALDRTMAKGYANGTLHSARFKVQPMTEAEKKRRREAAAERERKERKEQKTRNYSHHTTGDLGYNDINLMRVRYY